MEYQIEVEAPSPMVRSVTVVVPADAVEAEFARITRLVARGAAVPGFRPGKVPAAVVARHYGEKIRTEVQSAILDATLADGMRARDVYPVGRPEVTVGVLTRGAIFTYTARVEVQPEVTLQRWDGLEVAAAATAYDDAALAATLERMRRESAELVAVTDRDAVAADDLVTCDLELWAGARQLPRSRRENMALDLGEDGLIDGLAEGLVGAHVPGPHTVELPMPAGLRGGEGEPTLTVRLELKELKARRLPALDDEWARDLGAEDLATLTADVRARGEQHAREATAQARREAAIAALVRANPVELPPGMVRAEAERLVTADHEAQGGGTMPGDVRAARVEASLGRATTQLQAALLLLEVARAAEIEITDADIDAYVDEVARAYGDRESEVRAAFAEPSRRDDARFHLLEQRAIEAIVARAKEPAS